LKLVTFRGDDSRLHLGTLMPGELEILDFARVATEDGPPPLLEWIDLDQPHLGRAREIYESLVDDDARKDALRRDGSLITRSSVQLLAPVPRPGKVICIGLNYRDHAEESGMEVPKQPISFSKYSTSVVGPGDAVVIPPGSEQSDYEAELGVVIGRRTSRVSKADAGHHILGYVCFNDVSARDFQFADGQWQRGKSCDTFAPLGEFIATTDEIPDPHALSIKLHLNGRTMQDSSTDQLIFRIPELIEFLSQSITLEPGDVIATGTPPGVGFARKPPVYIRPGDEMTVDIEGLGTLTNPVRGPEG
jgi:2-keto-4-pentenoate hydratase/2-oxohepta-3-ene-1,7-dioic acid hydratase in catechol pathway